MSSVNAKSWPFEQARALLKHVVKKRVPAAELRDALAMTVPQMVVRWPNITAKPVIFETGYGPSGAPHIGTFGEVVRTNMVRRAFEELTSGLFTTQLIAFSDDYDGFRRVPDGYPESMSEHLGKPLSAVPDPITDADAYYMSFADRNNSALMDFIEELDINYTFRSASHLYKRGKFDEMLQRIFDNYQGVLDIILPTLGGQGGDRASTYSPFLPKSPITGKMIENANIRRNDDYTISYDDPEAYHFGLYGDIFGGNVKLQWKVDWGMRWAYFDVDYEMHGKDLIDSAVLSSRICKLLGGTPPLTYFYELFLDEEGKKISKSKGNGLTVEQWRMYGTDDALKLLMFQSPRSAKELHLGVIPRMQDDYLKALTTFPTLEGAARLDSPAWHLHAGRPPSFASDVSYGLLANLASATGDADEATVLGFLSQYRSIREEDRALVQSLVPKVVAYLKKQEEKNPRVRRPPTDQEASAFLLLATILEGMEDGLDGEAYQFQVYEVGKAYGFDPLRSWFQGLYEVLFGDSQGPRFGTFISAYGRQRTVNLLLRSVTNAQVE